MIYLSNEWINRPNEKDNSKDYEKFYSSEEKQDELENSEGNNSSDEKKVVLSGRPKVYLMGNKNNSNELIKVVEENAFDQIYEEYKKQKKSENEKKNELISINGISEIDKKGMIIYLNFFIVFQEIDSIKHGMNNYDQKFIDLESKIGNMESKMEKLGNQVNEIINLLKRNENEIKEDDKNGKD